jgi:hypothetical protein
MNHWQIEDNKNLTRRTPLEAIESSEPPDLDEL